MAEREGFVQTGRGNAGGRLPAVRLAPANSPGRVGGERGIRTPGTVSGTAVFKTAAFDRSAISPRGANYCGTRTCGFRPVGPKRRFCPIVPEIVPVAHWDTLVDVHEPIDARSSVAADHRVHLQLLP